MSMMKEFKTFAMKGNVVDMAVGIIIGGAFGKIVASFVNDVLMPPIGMLLGGMDFKTLQVVLREDILNEAGEVVTKGATIMYGNFIQTTIDFIIIAFAIFMMIKAMNNMKKKEEAKPAPTPPPPAPTKEELLLGEIRDLLKQK
ncbi:large-conductance mechanosensitive channel protein MscL [Mangrovibacterium sp.]|uniref:large-conductance mechanosensitive channel protein MscL n=1 Tax=Mangrovibacterium sp. TaxID=1961364 RepID=UPI0035694FC2